jgi:DNA (cytosine-5)-methyltransferase 1
MRYGSVCSGIEAATAAWHHMGWQPAFFSEIEKFPRAVLEHHYPEVPLHGDFTTIEQNQYGKIDLLVGGTPCQSFSIAGLRGGLDDDRGNLALEFCRLAQREQPRWIVWENVPGVLSSGGGRDFGSILGALEDLGYGLAYRVLDAQYFGVAQRRRRVFVVGYLGDWRPAAAVLFERHSMSGHPAPSREARQEAAREAAAGTGDRGDDGRLRPSVDVAPTLNAGGNRTGGDRPYGTSADTCDSLVVGSFNGDGSARTLTARYDSSPRVDRGPDVVAVVIAPEVANAITSSLANGALGHNKDENVIAFDAYNQAETGSVSKTVASRVDQDTASCIAFDTTQISSPHNYSSPQPGDPCHPLAAGAHPPAIAFPAEMSATQCASTEDRSPALSVKHTTAVAYSIMPMNSGKDYKARETDVAQPIMAAGPVGGNQGDDFVAASAVRRLTPVECERECERLQGFPDGFTAIPWGKKAADECPDGPRYKALGNSMAVPVMRWIGERIQLVDDFIAVF